jgi:hypothetical protein
MAWQRACLDRSNSNTLMSLCKEGAAIPSLGASTLLSVRSLVYDH